MTESGLALLISPVIRQGVISSGPAYFMDVGIFDPNTGKLLRRGEAGELWMRGPCFSCGYWKNAEKTAELFPFGPDSWLRTGDFCKIMDSGQVIIEGRIKEILKVRGQGQVAPAELEMILREHPAVAEAVVVGRPDQRHDQLPVAFVTVVPGREQPSPQELFAFVDPRVSEFKRLSEIKFVDSIPILYSGKVNRKALVQRLY